MNEKSFDRENPEIKEEKKEAIWGILIKAKSELLIHNGGFRIQFTRRKPCRWWRFWYWVLLGWRWRDI